MFTCACIVEALVRSPTVRANDNTNLFITILDLNIDEFFC